jgi:2-hydroxychromene-2-carboxylate isomerase
MHAAHWAEHRRIADPAVIEDVLAPIVGADVARDCLRRAQENEVKDLLAQRTQAAFDCGAFGLPWYQGMCTLRAPVVALTDS